MPKHALKTAAAALAFMLSASPLVAQDMPAPAATEENQPETETAPVAPVASEPVQLVDVDPALWVVKDEDTTIYLFGTVHVLRPGLSWFDDGIKTAFDSSGELVTEILDPDPTKLQTIVTTLAIDQTGTNLRDRLSDDQRVKYEAAMKDIGLPEAAFDQFEPWFAALTLGTLPLIKAGYDLNSGAEKTLTAAAKQEGKKLAELETAESQIAIFDELPMQAQIDYLNAVVDDIGEVTKTLDALVTEWSEAHPEKLAEILNSGFTDAKLYDALLTRRNAAWSRWIDERMKQPGTVFIAVGAGHLAGKGSVQDQLKFRGIETERVNY